MKTVHRFEHGGYTVDIVERLLWTDWPPYYQWVATGKNGGTLTSTTHYRTLEGAMRNAKLVLG